VADIARALHLDQKRLYRTIERLLARIGERLDAEGISRADARELFADGTFDFRDEEHRDAAPSGASVVTEGPWRRLR
jgi:hypothetical protein